MPRRTKPNRHNELARLFADPDAAREYLERTRWKGDPFCPFCGADKPYKLAPKKGSDKPVRPGVYKCSACRKQFTVTVRTIFEGSKIPLNHWLHAIHLMCASKKGV